MVSQDSIKDIVQSLKTNEKQKNHTYQAIVSRVDKQGIVWVNVAGSEIETPTDAIAAEVNRGDAVTVEWRNNKLYIASNYSDPAVGNTRAEVVERIANNAQYTAETALEDAVVAHEAAESATASAATAGRAASVAQAAAEAAQETANTKKTVFVTQPVPPYHVGDLWVREGDDEIISSLVTDQGFNIVDSDGNLFEAVIKGATVYVCVFARSSGAFVESDWSLAATDNTSVNELREWFWHDSLGAHVLGDATGYRNDITSTGMQIIDTSTESSVAIFGASGSQIGQSGAAHSVIDANGQRFYASNGTTQLANIGYGQAKEEGGTYSTNPYYTLGYRVAGVGVGAYSVAEGYDTQAIGAYSHAEGWGGSDAQTAGGVASHAEGKQSYAAGDYSHVEGAYNVAIGAASHVGGEFNTAGYDGQTVIGYYNNNKSANAFEIGNGTSNASSNALEVAWTGDVTAAGDITDGNGNVLSNKADASSIVTPDDYVTAHGTSGSWRYRKWNSGKIEAWFEGVVESSAGATEVTAPIYRGTWSLSIPSQIGFASAPNILITNNYEPTNVISINGKATSATAISGNFFRVDNQQATVTLYTRIYAWGVAS